MTWIVRSGYEPRQGWYYSDAPEQLTSWTRCRCHVFRFVCRDLAKAIASKYVARVVRLEKRRVE